MASPCVHPPSLALVIAAGLLAIFPSAGTAGDRVPNTTLAVPLAPPRFGYTTEPAFGALRFTDPVAIAAPRGETHRLFVAEQRGRVAVITNLASPNRTVFLDISARVAGGQPTDERGLLGLAFHPGYATNGHFFLFYSATTNGALHQRVSRFTAFPGEPHRADPGSEVILLSQRDEAGNHNGGDLHFGPDGYLYVSLGDEGNQNDALNNSQRIDRDYFSGILRLDVDQRPENLEPNPHPAVMAGTYRVPADNPWVGATSFNGLPVDPARVRTELWAVGLRNPWRMSFDPATGDLWAGDVGGSRREEINLIQGGGNYGWALREGTLSGPKAAQTPAGFTSIPPVAEYGHGSGPMQGRSVTGGVVYRGDRLSQLAGAYVFADYVSGNVWAVRRTGNGYTPMERLTGRVGIAGFGRDPRNGDVLMADQAADTIARLVYSDVASGDPLPPTLADTGAFADLATLEPQPGIVAYEINTPFWSDGALKQRWFSVPATNQFIQFRHDDPWQFPAGTVWIKHFELELTNGVPESRRRLETRFLVRNAQGMHGFTYRWTTPPTNALLVAEEGLDEPLEVRTAEEVRTQVWHYPSRLECLQCHTAVAGWALGFNTRQLNRGLQIEALARAGYFEEPPAESHTLPAHSPLDDEQASVEWRVRSWLDANCSSCHQPGGPALGAWDARARTPLSATGLIDGLLNQDEGDPLSRLVVRGNVDLSMIHSRVARLGEGRMPPVASSVVDEVAVRLLERWILGRLPQWQSYPEWQTARFGTTTHPSSLGDADADMDGSSNALEHLVGSDPLAAGPGWRLEAARDGQSLRLRWNGIPHRAALLEWTDRPGEASSWRPLDVPANRHEIPEAPGVREVFDAAGQGARFYRVRLWEP